MATIFKREVAVNTDQCIYGTNAEIGQPLTSTLAIYIVNYRFEHRMSMIKNNNNSDILFTKVPQTVYTRRYEPRRSHTQRNNLNLQKTSLAWSLSLCVSFARLSTRSAIGTTTRPAFPHTWLFGPQQPIGSFHFKRSALSWISNHYENLLGSLVRDEIIETRCCRSAIIGTLGLGRYTNCKMR